MDSADYKYVRLAAKLVDKKSRSVIFDDRTAMRQVAELFATPQHKKIGVIHTAQKMRISIPMDLVVVGYDDSPIASLLRPSLTILRRPNKEMARIEKLPFFRNASFPYRC
ncbi:MAG: substrate-binding domain-containing protein [Exilibacterium sp.]